MTTVVWKKIAVAAAVGIAVASAQQIGIARQKKEIRESLTMTTLLRLKKYLPQGKTLSADMVEEVPAPLSAKTPALLSFKKELLGSDGRALFKARLGILKGDWVNRSMLVDGESEPALAWALEAGQNAWSLRLRPEDAVGGLLQPGDIVDVVCANEKKSQTLLPGVRVLAVGEKIWDKRGTDEAKPVSFAEDMLVTLALSPNDVVRLSGASQQSRVSLALVSPLESQP